jgi:hypothetical protein
VHRRIYFKKSEAIKLGREWRKVLLWKNLPLFGCPNVRTAVVHSLISPRLSADVATRMIAIIKRRAIQGIAITVDNLLFVSVGS